MVGRWLTLRLAQVRARSEENRHDKTREQA
jgi:hypothetical protein